MADEEINYKKLYDEEKKKVDILEKENAALKSEPEKRGYFALRRIANLQIDILLDFKLKENIGGKKSEDATFERTQAIWTNLPAMLTSLSELKNTLKVTPEEEKQNQHLTKTYNLSSPESVANVLGNTAGQRN